MSLGLRVRVLACDSVVVCLCLCVSVLVRGGWELAYVYVNQCVPRHLYVCGRGWVCRLRVPVCVWVSVCVSVSVCVWF